MLIENVNRLLKQNKYLFESLKNKANKATTLSGYGITDAYTKTEIDNKVSVVFRYKGSVATYVDLTALTGMTIGDVYNVTETGDNYAWTGTEWDKLAGEIDLSAYLTSADASNTYETIANVNSLSTIVSGNTGDISDLQTDKADKATTLAGYAITDAYTKTEIDTNLENYNIHSDVTYEELLNLITNNELIPGSSYRITNYTTTTVQANTQSAGHNFDIIVTALSINEISENAKCVRKSGDTYFTNANLEAWEIKYCINNDTSRFAWADTVNGKGVIYYMKDEWGNECPYDFKNIQYQIRPGFNYSQWGTNYTFTRDSSLDMIIADVQYYGYVGDNIPGAWSSNTCWLRDNPATTASIMYESSGYVIDKGGNITAVINENYDVFTFSNTKTTSEDFDVSLNGLLNSCYSNTIRPYFTTQEPKCQLLNRIIFVGLYCYGNMFGDNCYNNTFGDNCYNNTFGNSCQYNKFGNSCRTNTFGNSCSTNTFGNSCPNNTFGNNCYNNTFDSCSFNTLGNDCSDNTLGYSPNNTFGYGCYSNTFDYCSSNTFGNRCYNNTFGRDCTNNTFGNNCNNNNFYAGTSGTTKKDFIKYLVLENGCSYNNFYSTLTTSFNFPLQRIRIKGLENSTPTDTQITLSELNTKYEWLICYTSSGTPKQYCPND